MILDAGEAGVALNDGELLRRYAAGRDQAAFGELARRHLDWVYSAALRITRDAELAEDVAQGVFLLLAQANRLSRHPQISGWLFQATRFGAQTMARGERRRKKHEARAMKPTDGGDIDRYWADIQGTLESAVAKLGAEDRAAILLRFYRQLTLEEVGAALGISPDAARMRVARAIGRLRLRLAAMQGHADNGAGGEAGGGEGILSAGLLAHGVHAAPGHVMAMVVKAGAAAAGGSGALAVSKGVQAMMTAAKLKMAGAGMVAVALLAGAATTLKWALGPGEARTAATMAAQTSPRVPVPIGKETTVISGPLRADGTVDYVKAINDKYGAGVTPENNGYVLWLKAVGTGPGSVETTVRDHVLAMAAAEGAPADDLLRGYDRFLNDLNRPEAALRNANEEMRTLATGLWRAADHPDMAAYLKANEGVLDRIEQAAEKPRWWVPAVAQDGRGLWTVQMWGSVGPYLYARQALSARAALRAEAGDFAGFKRDVFAMKALARAFGGLADGTLRSEGEGFDASASGVIAAIAGTGRLTEGQCRELTLAIDALPPMPNVREAVDVFDRWQQLDLLANGKFEALESYQGMDLHYATGSGSYTPQFHDGPEDVDYGVAMKAANAVFDEMLKLRATKDLMELEKMSRAMEAQHDQWWKEEVARGERFARIPGETQQAYSERFGRLTATVWDHLTRSPNTDRMSEIVVDLTRELLAAAAVKARTGTWPATLEALVPGEFQALPSQRNAGVVRYSVTDAGARISLIGPNGKEDTRNSIGVRPPAGAATDESPAATRPEPLP